MTDKFAFVFPGQGSQSVGMLMELADHYPIIRDTFTEASSVLGYHLFDLAKSGPPHLLNQTEKTQPVLLAASVAIWRIWKKHYGATPALLAGHSLGEYSALVIAEALDYIDAIRLVSARGRFMQDAVPEGRGAMAAIVGLSDQQVQNLCDEAAQGQVITPANYNANGQVVISGEDDVVERAVALAKKAGAKIAKRLPVSVPSHCILMKPAAEKLAQALEDVAIQTPKIPFVNNVDVKIKTNPDDIRDALVRQLYSPVRWVETVHTIAEEGINDAIECGPGKVLSGLIRRIEPEMKTTQINAPENMQEALQHYST